ncbi:ABC transporter permease [Phytoactinopolyspora mesophila]|uniref:FtsX-like permease family protein n=1 Tax=Phytoactinopolyspora mesophila TaxID=2650750 RepID=A0A7K3M0N1_9ACTN|nr:ABC transporter permease [Phytoactinopolyspora mesophila]NDL56810.1 hypothetical protein [Phytoactinopolyspora mesophila]
MLASRVRGPFRRERIFALVSVVLVVGLLGATLAREQVEARVEALLDENWRGAYDILVTSAENDFGGDTDGFVEANFVSMAGESAIAADDLESIRAIDGVEVAAPIGFVGLLRGVSTTPTLEVADDPAAGVSDIEDGALLARITSTLVRDEPGGTVEVSRSRGHVYLSAREDVGEPGQADYLESAAGEPHGFSPMITDKGYLVPLGMLPEFGSGVIAVDAEAEQQLLGGAEFLDALRSVPENRTAGAAEEILESIDADRYLVQSLDIRVAMDDPELSGQDVVPLVVNSSPLGAASALRIEVEIELAEDAALESPPGSGRLRELTEDSAFSAWRAWSEDVSDLVVPFSTPTLSFTWPESVNADPEEWAASAPATQLQPALVGRPAYRAHEVPEPLDQTPGFVVEPQGAVGPDGLIDRQSEHGIDSDVGLSQAYRLPREVDGDGFDGAFPGPVGTFSEDDLVVDDTSVSYVPMGAYDPARTRLIKGPDGDAADQQVVANLSGLDFITGQPGAFTDLEGGAALRGHTPIDAIRVRVGNVDGYTAAAYAEVTDVAAQITELGLTATVVAGSSPQPVAIYVPDYHVDGDGAAVSDLGWVTQDWTTLGATISVRDAMTGIQRWLLFVGLGAAMAAALIAALLTAHSRRREVGVLQAVGWSDAQIRRKLLTRLGPGVALVLTGSLVTFMSRGGDGAVRVSAVSVAIAAVLALFVSVRFSFSLRLWRRGWRSRPLMSAADLALRRVLRAPFATSAQLTGFAVLGASAAGVVGAFVAARHRAGATRLAGAVLDETLLGSVLLGAVGCFSAGCMAVLARRSLVDSRSADQDVLERIGISRASIRAVDTWENVIIGGAAVIVTTAVAIGVSAATAVGFGGPLAAAAVVAAVLALMSSPVGQARGGR